MCIYYKHEVFILKTKNDRMYNIWKLMVGRCTNPNWKNWFTKTHYYDKGIKVCDDWLDFDIFYEWAMANGYNDSLSIDRINPDGNYEPSNCRWIPLNMNKGLAHKSPKLFIEYQGKRISIKEASQEYDISYATLYSRIKRGWSIKKAIETPLQKIKERPN